VYLTAVINVSDFRNWKFYCALFIWFRLWLISYYQWPRHRM